MVSRGNLCALERWVPNSDMPSDITPQPSMHFQEVFWRSLLELTASETELWEPVGMTMELVEEYAFVVDIELLAEVIVSCATEVCAVEVWGRKVGTFKAVVVGAGDVFVCFVLNCSAKREVATVALVLGEEIIREGACVATVHEDTICCDVTAATPLESTAAEEVEGRTIGREAGRTADRTRTGTGSSTSRDRLIFTAKKVSRCCAGSTFLRTEPRSINVGRFDSCIVPPVVPFIDSTCGTSFAVCFCSLSSSSGSNLTLTSSSTTTLLFDGIRGDWEEADKGKEAVFGVWAKNVPLTFASVLWATVCIGGFATVCE